MKHSVKDLIIAALCLAIGIVLPFVTGQVPAIGNMLLPMHIPVFVCAFTSSKTLSVLVGLVLPLFRSVLFSRPVFFPNAVAMAVELATYALVASCLYACFKRRNIAAVYGSMIPAMLLGRIAWGLFSWLIFGLSSASFTLSYFFAEAFLYAIPGVVLQLIVVPVLVMLIRDDHHFG
ncbi:MAG: ECF transporter S component [Ruminococcaceae bacterium]|nr:ECF transporter S component [Oscillospiraceae bacterium]